VVARRWAWLVVLVWTSLAGPPPLRAAPGSERAVTPTTTAAEQPSTTQPARLALVGRTAENWIYIDKPTLRRLTNDKYELWAQVKQSRGDTVKMLLQVNCADRSYLVKASATYADDGSVVDNYTPRSPSLQYIVPDSAAEYIHAAICKR
jgi:hypothetical protein